MQAPSRVPLRVIEGGAQRVPPLLRLPRAVLGPSPFEKASFVAYRVATGDVRKALSVNRRQPVLDLWSMVIGQLPPVPNVSKHEGLTEEIASQAIEFAYAAFRGVRRPVGDDPHGFDTAVFITKPTMHFRYTPDMVCVVEPVGLPDDVVLATYVKLDFPAGRPSTSRKSGVPVGGAITHWELVERDGLLPVHHKERYRQRLW